ncbi:ribonuclease H-like domain-containing protein [Candidatus Wolfebacteria bacterium]|nr:ribonuclease H-like domain-containing protein [Candidatus Wolfebacteria bacterium]
MSTPKLIFDIETIGADFDSLDKTTQDVLTRWIKKESEDGADYEESLKNLKEGLGFSPLTGEIIVIGTLDYEKNQGGIYFQAPGKEIEDFTEDGIKFKQMTEKEMLSRFWQIANQYGEFVSFNGRGFDGPFLMIRSAVHGIAPTKNLSESRYLYQQRTCVHIDLIDQLTFYGNMRKKGGLHLWSNLFGIESPKAEGVSGDDVSQLFKSGKFLEIAKYNARDLKATKELYEKWKTYLNF